MSYREHQRLADIQAAGLRNRRRGFEQAERWLTLADANPDQPSLAEFLPPKMPPVMICT